VRPETRAEKTWEFLFRLAVPLSIAGGAAIINHEVRLGEIQQRQEDHGILIERHDRNIGDMPTWLRMELIADIKAQGAQLNKITVLLEAVDQRLSRLEGTPRPSK
jgi:hypothetical protein